MVTPSAPTLGSVEFKYSYPHYRPSKGELLKTNEEKVELCDATDELLAGHGYLRGVEMNFLNGSVILTVESQHDPEYSGTLLLDVVATKFFQDNKEYIANINPSLASRIENNITKDIRKISEVFYCNYKRYLEEYTNEETGLDNLVEGSTIVSSKPGFKNFHYYAHHENRQVTSLDTLKEAPGTNFKKFIQTLPTSLLSHKGSKKAVLFLQAGLDQKTSYSDKLLYLKQVLFLLTFQDVFKHILQTMQKNLSIEKYMLYTSPNRDHDISQESQYIQKRLELLETTLSKLPVSDVVLLIPLACRSSMSELSEHSDFLESGNTVEKDYLMQECDNARRADVAIRHILKNSFHIIPKNFSVNKNDRLDEKGIESIESYLMGISGLAISPGLMGRLPMRNHHTIYYKRTSEFNIPNVSDNFPVEFLLTAAQFYSSTNDDWIEEKCLGYVTEMMGRISPHELDAIKAKIQHVRQAVEKAPVDTLLKQRSNQYLLRNSSIEKLCSLYKIAREQVGLEPLPDTHSSSCSII